MKRIVSGITPSGDGTLHIGNYLGAVRQFKELAKTNDCFLFVADFHALTTIQNKSQLQKNVETLILNELALLGDLNNITFYRQSDIGLHSELQTIINNVTPLGLLKRAHAYKDKLQKDMVEDEINLGLFNYPILMAADILMYKADLVPVGKDQKQHVEITRDIAEKFNRIYKRNIFKLPDAYIPSNVANVIGTDGKRKMSKTLGNIISIFEPEEVIRKQVMSTYTDPTRVHATDPGHIEGNMVFAYLDYFGDKQQVASLKERYTQGKVADVEVKEYLFKSLMKYFKPARDCYEELKNNPDKVKEILQTGAQRAKEVAHKTMKEVRDAIGITNQYSLLNLKTKPSISFDDFTKLDLRIAKILKAEVVANSDKLIKITLDVGELGQRVVAAGIREFYSPEELVGKTVVYLANLEPRDFRGIKSQGMLIAAGAKEAFIISPEKPVKPGEIVR
jgi:tryptophanyl-tRNA synthetase